MMKPLRKTMLLCLTDFQSLPVFPTFTRHGFLSQKIAVVAVSILVYIWFISFNLFHYVSLVILLLLSILLFLSIAMGMFSITQPDLVANKRKTSILSCNISKDLSDSSVVKFLWAPFPIEMCGVSMIVPSPSGSKLLVIRNPENNEAPSCFEIWSSSHMEKEFHIPHSTHGSVYNDGWSVIDELYSHFYYYACLFTLFNVKLLQLFLSCCSQLQL